MTIRIIASISAALPITFSLMLLMQFLIATGTTPIDDRLRLPIPQIFLVPPESDLIRKNERVTPPPPVPKPPTRFNPVENAGDANPVIFNFPQPSLDYKQISFEPTMADGELAPIVRVNPIYPVSAAKRGIEGFVTVEFTVNRTGAVADVHVINSTHRLFERAAVAAVYRWRYKPRVINGQAISVTGVRTLLTFKIEN